jgi:quercetin dioxygenase-like cupin family protein
MSESPKKNPWIDLAPGIRRRTVTHGATMYQMVAELKAGSIMPEHQHPQEQIIHILAGRMRVIVGGISRELCAGDSHYLASNVPHGVETIENTTVLDTFSPPRNEYIAIDEDVAAH